MRRLNSRKIQRVNILLTFFLSRLSIIIFLSGETENRESGESGEKSGERGEKSGERGEKSGESGEKSGEKRRKAEKKRRKSGEKRRKADKKRRKAYKIEKISFSQDGSCEGGEETEAGQSAYV